MGPILPLDLLGVDQPQVRLIHEGRGLQTVPAALARHAAPRNPPQLVVYQGDQLVEGGLVAFSPCEEKSGDLVRAAGNAPILRFFSPCASQATVFPHPSARGDAMARTTAGVAVVVAVWIASVATRSDAATGPERVLVLHVIASAHASRGDLAEAKQWVTGVYREAGVRAVWTDGPAAAAQPDGAFHADVLLLSREMVTGKSQLDALDGHVMGTASRPSRRAYIFYNRIADHARLTVSNVALLLGMVIAHEVGHLLLPASSHSAAGIMCATWQRRFAARLPTFTGDQATTIRQLLAAGSGNQSQP